MDQSTSLVKDKHKRQWTTTALVWKICLELKLFNYLFANNCGIPEYFHFIIVSYEIYIDTHLWFLPSNIFKDSNTSHILIQVIFKTSRWTKLFLSPPLDYFYNTLLSYFNVCLEILHKLNSIIFLRMTILNFKNSPNKLEDSIEACIGIYRVP